MALISWLYDISYDRCFSLQVIQIVTVLYNMELHLAVTSSRVPESGSLIELDLKMLMTRSKESTDSPGMNCF